MTVVPKLLAERAKSNVLDPFVEIGGVLYTYGEIAERAHRLAAGLASLGVKQGDRVATILPNRIEHVDVIFACARLGAIHVPTNVFLKGDFLAHQLADCGASVMIADDEGLAALSQVRDRLASLEHVLHCDDLPGGPDVPPVDVVPGDPMSIVYTSGTTGMPKGCVLPYGYHIPKDNEILEYRSSDVIFTALPLFHGWARGMLFAALVHGLSVVLEDEFSATTALERIIDTGATVFSGVGAMGIALLGTPPSALDRQTKLRVAFMIPFAAHHEAAFKERFGVRVQSQMYGQTETGAISFTPLRAKGKPGTVGKPSPLYDVQIAKDGEVLVRPKKPDVMYIGYWGNADATADAMRGGWHHTGDLARIDKDGFLTFVDRKKDALRRRGENVSSVQLESAIVAHPKITEAAIVAVPSVMTEDDIKACLVASDDVTPEELFEFFKQTLPYFAIPRYVEIVDALPKTATMRVQKHLLRLEGVNQQTWDFEKLGLAVPRDERR
jgi:crotonobetaine/carnitine-CoA ligase